MANSKSLTYVGTQQLEISYYIITDSKQEVINNDGTGNIIVLTSDGQGATSEDVLNSDSSYLYYRDLYVGDEHIAGGFGFKDITTRDNILSYIKDLQNSVVNINEILANSNISNIDDNKLSIDTRHDSFAIDNTDYVLEITESNKLRLNRIDRLSFDQIKLYSDVKTLETENLVIPVNSSITFNKLEFVCSGSYPLADLTVFSTKDTQNYNLSESNSLIYNEYHQSFDPESTAFTGKYEISFDDKPIKFSSSTNKEVQLHIALSDTNGESIVKYLPKIIFKAPFYWMCSGYFDSNSNISNIDNKQYGLTEGNPTKFEMKFEHGLEETYGWLFIPHQYLTSNSNIELLFDGNLQIKTNWELMWDININNINYKTFRTSVPYKGDVSWLLTIK